MMKMIQYIKQWLKKFINKAFQGLYHRSDELECLIRTLEKQLDRIEGNIRHPDKGTQILLALKYQDLFSRFEKRLNFDEIEFRAYSQNGEDGILLYIFSLIGTINKTAIEMCAGDGQECNSANLIINHGWNALLIDGDQTQVEQGRAFYSSYERCRDTWIWPPKFVHAWVTAENVNQLLQQYGFTGDIDVLSIDVDGVDYWLWQAIDCITPRVVIVEYQDMWGPEQAVTVPYDPNFRAIWHEGQTEGEAIPIYAGASLAAFVKLGRSKGYRLIGCQRYGFNAFFMRNGVGDDLFPEIPVERCFTHPKTQYGIRHYLPKAMQYEWEEV